MPFIETVARLKHEDLQSGVPRLAQRLGMELTTSVNAATAMQHHHRRHSPGSGFWHFQERLRKHRFGR
jgi:hypothetical protein